MDEKHKKAMKAKGYMQKKDEESSFQKWLKGMFSDVKKRAEEKGRKRMKDASDKKR